MISAFAFVRGQDPTACGLDGKPACSIHKGNYMANSAPPATSKTTAGCNGAKSSLYRTRYGELEAVGISFCFEPKDASHRQEVFQKDEQREIDTEDQPRTQGVF